MADGHLPIEQMECFQRYVQVGNWAWSLVSGWPHLAIDTLGKQLIRACDSIGANLVEGDGRHGTADALHFFIVARASAREARFWLNRAVDRGLIARGIAETQIEELNIATRQLNQLIRYRRDFQRASRVSDGTARYDSGPRTEDDPFTEDD